MQTPSEAMHAHMHGKRMQANISEWLTADSRQPHQYAAAGPAYETTNLVHAV